MATFSTNFAADINNVLAEEANRIGSDIHKATLHTSPWMDLIKQTSFPDESGYNLTTLVYDRVLPTNSAGSAIGQDWNNIADATNGLGTTSFGTAPAPRDVASSLTNDNVDALRIQKEQTKSYAHISKKLKQYNLQRAAVESPRISVEDLRFASHRNDQLRAITEALAESTKYTWETRYRDEYERLSGNLVVCSEATAIRQDVDDAATTDTTKNHKFEGLVLQDATAANAVNVENNIADADAGNLSAKCKGISNAVMDKIYNKIVRTGGGKNAYGRENGRPVFGLVCSSEASYKLMTESEFRTDIRYNNNRVSDLIAPLGVEQSFRGFYHLIDDAAPRYNDASDDGIVEEVLPYTTSSGVISVNDGYDEALYEVAYVIHPDVMESQIPQPLSGAAGISFDPVSYKGDFKWLNIPDVASNPDGTIGFFRGVLASASKPIKTDFGYVLFFKRNTAAAGV